MFQRALCNTHEGGEMVHLSGGGACGLSAFTASPEHPSSAARSGVTVRTIAQAVPPHADLRGDPDPKDERP
jgi:hypothetical protein